VHTPTLLRRWAELYPDVELQLVQVDHRSAGLHDGRADAAVIRGPVTGPGLRSEHLLDEVRVAAVPAEHRLADRPQLALTDLADDPVVVNTVSGTTGAALWPPDRRPARTVEVTSTEDWLAAIAAGRGVGVTVSATAELSRYPGVRFLPLTGTQPVPVSLAWTDPPTHPAIEPLIHLAREVVPRQPRS
jgi:DNA-binding transcriptional LysR family regulator